MFLETIKLKSIAFIRFTFDCLIHRMHSLGITRIMAKPPANKVIKLNKADRNEIACYRAQIYRAVGQPENIDLVEQVTGILNIINEQQIHQLAYDVYLIVETIPKLKASAIETLGFYLQSQWFKDLSYELFIQEEEAEVQFAALLSWGGYFYGSKNAEVLEILYKILVGDSFHIEIKKLAINLMFNVAGVDFCINTSHNHSLIGCQSTQLLHQIVDWRAIVNLLQKYAPQALQVFPIWNYHQMF